MSTESELVPPPTESDHKFVIVTSLLSAGLLGLATYLMADKGHTLQAVAFGIAAAFSLGQAFYRFGRLVSLQGQDKKNKAKV